MIIYSDSDEQGYPLINFGAATLTIQRHMYLSVTMDVTYVCQKMLWTKPVL